MILKTICLVLVCQKKQINLAVERRGTFTSSDRHCQPSLSILFSLVVCPIFIFFLFSDPLCNFPISWKAKPQQLKEECIKSVGRSRNGYPSSCYIRFRSLLTPIVNSEFSGEHAKGEYGAFSNRSNHRFEIAGNTWPTVEHYFQVTHFVSYAHHLIS